jgi:cytochrome c oxidase subunit 1
MLGAEDVAFPKLNLLSWYCFVVGALMAVISVIFGGIDTGWTFYVPYSLQTGTTLLWPILAAFILGWSSVLTGINFVVTAHRMRDPRLSFFKMPLFVWALYATGWVQVIATPVIGITLVLLLLERGLGIPIFDPTRGGDPVLFEHLFWIYSHPAVYIMLLPAMGVVSEIIPTFSRKTIFGYKFIAFSSVAIAAIGSLVWGHHMFTTGMGDTARIVFSFLTFLVAVPSAVKVFNWVATMYKGSIEMATPMVWTMMFIFLFSIGGLTGLYLATLGPNIHLHDTAFVPAHFHYTMLGGVGTLFFGALHYWWPKMFGKMYDQKKATIYAVLFFVGFNLIYFSLFLAGYFGMPRRYADYLPEYTIYHRMASVGGFLMALAFVLIFWNLLVSLRKGKDAPENPWGGATLEWRTATPPPTLNFDGEPDLSRGAYDYPEQVEDV